MSELTPDTCHPRNTIRGGVTYFRELDSGNPGLPKAAPKVRFLDGVFMPSRTALQLNPRKELALLVTLMGLTAEGTPHIFKPYSIDPTTIEHELLETLGIEKRHEAPPLLFDSKRIRIIKPVTFPAELSEEERKIVTYLSTGLTSEEITTVLNLERETPLTQETLKTTVDTIGERAGVHNVAGLKTLGWLSGMAIGSMQYRHPTPVLTTVPSAPPIPQLSLVH